MRCTWHSTVFQSKENGFTICRYATEEPNLPTAARSKFSTPGRTVITAKGYNLPTTDAVDFELTGQWEDSKYGLQLSVESFRELVPQTKEGIIGYLSSGLIKGVGPKMAAAIYGAFGLQTMEVLENRPEELLRIRGISPQKLEKIRLSFQDSRALRDIVARLSPYGISAKKAAKVLEAFGGNAMEILQNQPFRLCEIKGFGFKIVDAIARAVRCSPSDPLRIGGGLCYLLDEAEQAGHLFLPYEELLQKAHLLLNEGLPQEKVTRPVVEARLNQLLAEKRLICEIRRVYKPDLRKAEVDVARKALMMLSGQNSLPADMDTELIKSQSSLGLTLSEKQAEAVRMWAKSPLSIITGGPGTGKTTTLRVILDIYKRVRPKGEILLAAPTGRASRRMVESTGHPAASTLHSALGLYANDGEEYFGGSIPLEADLVIVDEVSMIDMRLAAELFRRVETGTQLLLVGDPDQLPSVGPGNVLRELLRCRLIPTVHLDIAYRQKNASRIALDAHAINQGRKDSLFYGEDFRFLPANQADEAAQIVLNVYQEAVTHQNLLEVQILAPFRSRGECSVKRLNEEIQKRINPPDPCKKEIKYSAQVFRELDKVIQTKNREAVSNGDVGLIVSITQDEEEGDTVRVLFSDERAVDYSAEELSQLELAYATTIHKSQGSEYHTVIIPILKDQYIMLRRNLIYTAVSRAKQQVTLVGQKQALHIAIDKNDIDQRNTLLADRIVSYYRQMNAGERKNSA